jgi:hypothetical protein
MLMRCWTIDPKRRNFYIMYPDQPDDESTNSDSTQPTPIISDEAEVQTIIIRLTGPVSEDEITANGIKVISPGESVMVVEADAHGLSWLLQQRHVIAVEKPQQMQMRPRTLGFSDDSQE